MFTVLALAANLPHFAAGAPFNALPPDGWPSTDEALDCAMRQEAFKYAGQLKNLDKGELAAVADGLQLSASGTCAPNQAVIDAAPATIDAAQPAANFATTFYVDAVKGSDANAGTSEAKAFKTVQKAADAAGVKSATRPVGIYLSASGTHYLSTTLELGPQHSGVTFTSMTGEAPVLSGGVPLTDLKWSPAMEDPHPASKFFRNTKNSKKNATGIMVADVPAGTDFMELWADGKRQIRARWPNGLQNSGATYPRGYATGTFEGDDNPLASDVVKDKECRSDDGAGSVFPCQSWIVGGSGARYDPPFMYNDKDDLAVKKPLGMSMDPQEQNAAPAAEWTNVDKAITQCFTVDTGGAAMLRKNKKRAKQNLPPFEPTPRMQRFAARRAKGLPVREVGGGADPADDVLPQWGGWWAAIESRSKDKLTFKVNITEKGMWQDQAQTAGSGDASGFFIENIKEELDASEEWYLDTDASKLYYKPNATDRLASGATELVYSHLELSTLVRIMGGMANGTTVADVAFEGITFMHASPTIMKQYFIPSCGDWSIYRGGAVYIEGAERLRFHNNVFNGVGGNAIFAYGFLGNSNITHNEFKWIGNSAIAFQGRYHLHDATGGFYPQDNLVANNHAHETGMFDIESSFYFESVSGHNQVINNIMYNGPRAAINFNDGGVGGTVTRGNLIFGHGRESSDHGPINSWDRCPFKTLRGQYGNTPSQDQLFVPAKRFISRNFVMNGGILFDCITHDDGASHYVDTNNVLMYGGNQNNNAYYNAFDNNLMIQPHINSNYPMPGYDALNCDSDSTGNSANGNTIIMKGHECSDPYGSGIKMDVGDDSFPPNSSTNALYTDKGKWGVYTGCNPTGVGCFADARGPGPSSNKGCKSIDLAAWQKESPQVMSANANYDSGSTEHMASEMPTAAIVAAVVKILKTNIPPSSQLYGAEVLRPSWMGDAPGSKIRTQRAPRAAWSKKLTADALAGWQKFWDFAGGPFWTKCGSTKSRNDPCSCEMVTCSGTDIVAVNFQGDTGVQGPVVWISDVFPKLVAMELGATLNLTCDKAGPDHRLQDDAGKAKGDSWTCVQDKTPPSPAPPGPSPAPGPPPPPGPSSYISEPKTSCDGDTIKNLPDSTTLKEAQAACDKDVECGCICADKSDKSGWEVDKGTGYSSDGSHDSWIKQQAAPTSVSAKM